MFKRLLVALFVLLFSVSPAIAQSTSADSLLVASLLATPRGRSVGISDNVAYRIYFDGNTTANFSASWNTGQLSFFEDNAVVTTIPQLNAGIMYTDKTTADTVGEIVSLINLDSNGKWHAIQGPDATSGTVASANTIIDVDLTTIGRNKANALRVFHNNRVQQGMFCGVEPTDGAVNRIEEFTASGHSLLTTGLIEIWSDSERLYGIDYTFPNGGSFVTGSASKIVAEKTFNSPGIGGDFGEGIVFVLKVDHQSDTDGYSNYQSPAGLDFFDSLSQNRATGNVSIMYNVFNLK